MHKKKKSTQNETLMIKIKLLLLRIARNFN